MQRYPLEPLISGATANYTDTGKDNMNMNINGLVQLGTPSPPDLRKLIAADMWRKFIFACSPAPVVDPSSTFYKRILRPHHVHKAR